MRWPLTPGQWAIVGFTAAYLLAAAVAAVVTGNGEFLFYLVVMLVLVAVIDAIHWRVGFSTPLLALLSIWGALHMAGGLVPVPDDWPISGNQRVLYSWWVVVFEEIPWMSDAVEPSVEYFGIKYDHIVHAFGFGVTTWACWQGLVGSTGVTRPTLGRLTLVGAAALGFGALNEVGRVRRHDARPDQRRRVRQHRVRPGVQPSGGDRRRRSDPGVGAGVARRGASPLLGLGAEAQDEAGVADAGFAVHQR